MEKNQIHTDKAGKTVGPYSQAIEYNGIVYVSGVTAIDPQTGFPTGTVEEQTEKILTTIEEVLEAAGSSMEKVLKATIFLNDVNDFAKVNAVYAKHFREPYPARICVQVAKIPLGALVEIDAIAHK
ncbi:RutC family protein [Peptoclostridium acidaminophilum DSM 3953]|uniref:RutC family protein n=1 Tax=Peptoclostridium acidaminophilum DSM 3953 TaxID=1286171 RepID=W8TIC7_PEPAC|nr:Rid family detoxifying hydrolase [Peptoclostridium acidaminophilum]AHM55962.1 RutC family protein [Peptoclostridium acidaminophilum DSM 3953]